MSASMSASWRRLRRHRVPTWYDDAKLGIFIHWSVSSVIGWAARERDINQVLREDYDNAQAYTPYTEWYPNSVRLPGSPAAEYHRRTYGDRPYESFAADFERGVAAWDPASWAAGFRRAGARYVVLVTKHHDGYCLWPSRVANPRRGGWFSRRDCVGELAQAVRAEGMRFGVYYSGGLDWTFDPSPIRTMADGAAAVPGGEYPQYAEAQVRELIEQVQPEILWNDIAWPAAAGPLCRLLADYYAAVPEGVANDRWLPKTPLSWLVRSRAGRKAIDALLRRKFRKPGASLQPPPLLFGDYQTPEYTSYAGIRRRKWECVRGMDKSFGYNRNSRPEDFLTRTELLQSLVDIVAKNGNLLLNVGPRGEDAIIPEAQLQRLDWVGDWLAVHGEAIHATRPWVRPEDRSLEGYALRYTARDRTVFAFVFDPAPATTVTIPRLAARPGHRVALVGGEPLRWEVVENAIRVFLPERAFAAPVTALALEGFAACDSF